jgi:hypothetical protein
VGIYCYLRRVSERVIDHLLASPEDTLDVLFLEQVPDGVTPTWGPPDVGRGGTLEKDWAALHFLLSGRAPEAPEDVGARNGLATFLMQGGEPLDDAELAHPPTRALRPSEVRRVADFLAALDPDTLRGRFDPARMSALEIYPSGAWADAGAEELDALIDRYEELRAFVAEAAAAGEGLLVSIG